MNEARPTVNAGATARMAALTAVSRSTGFVRTVVVAAVLGTSYLGNLYQSTNAVPNILFELFAAGVLQTVLVPVMVDVLDGQDTTEAERAAGAVYGLVAVVLGGLAAIGAVAAPWIVRGLTAGVSDPEVREAMVSLGRVMLWIFLPQVVLYAAALVATAVLNARGRYGLPAVAPAVNNLVVVAAYLGFALLRDGKPPGLDLDAVEIAVLAGGTTAAVVAFCLVPVLGAARIGVRLRPRWEPHHPAVRRVLRQGAWGAVYVGAGQVLLLATTVLANGVEGGVVIVGVAQVLFLLPHSLVSVPIATTVVPTLTRAHREGDTEGYRAALSGAVRSLLYLTLPGAAVVAVLGVPLAGLVAYGNAAGRIREIGHAIAAFSPGIVGFGVLLLLARAAYARGDARTPALVAIAVAALGVVAAILTTRALPSGERGAAIGLAYAGAQVVGALLAAATLGVRQLRVTAALSRSLVGGAVAAGVAAAVVTLAGAWTPVDRFTAAIVVTLGGGLGAVASVMVQWGLGGPSPRVALATLGAGR